MTAVTADRDPQFGDGDYIWLRSASGETIYAGTMVMLNASGLAEAATDNSANIFIGVATNYSASGTDSATAGSIPSPSGMVCVKTTGTFLCNYSGTLTLADIGTMPAIVDNATLGPVASASGDVRAGIIVEVPSATTCRVLMGVSNHLDLTTNTTLF